MTKTKVILKIKDFTDGNLILNASDLGVRAAVKNITDLCNERYGGYIKLEMTPPYKPRSTGKGSQNSKIWACIQQIAQETGNDIDDVEDYIKMKAVARGYPYKVSKLSGQIRPSSMRDINTAEANLLIEELKKLASELGIVLED